MVPVPDLLCHSPAVRLDAQALKQTLTFGFASGVPASALAQHVESETLPASTWESSAFEKELFVSDLVAGCCQVKISGRPYAIDRKNLVRVLTRPPSDEAHVELRREVLRELAESPSLRAEFERVYVVVHQFRTLLEAPPIARRAANNRRRLDILTAIQSAIDTMAESLAGATSALSRLHAFGEAVRATTAYQRLSDLLHYEENVSTLDVRVRIGFDGRVRGLEMLAVRENQSNWFYASPLGRFFAKLGSLLRGYRFSEQELLARLIDRVFEGLEDELVQLFQVLFDMEFYLAALAFRDLAAEAGLAVCLPHLEPFSETSRAGRVMRGLFNPLLLAQGIGVVPCDVDTSRPDVTLIVTGPNSGGKTRLLQSLALSQMLGQAGFFVPASEARLTIAPGLFVSLIEEATADQSEGRLGTELIRIRSLFEKLRVGSMVVLDELCSGTNPSEGEEIFELVVTLLAELAPQAFITTHFLQMANRIAAKPPVSGLLFLQVELDRHQIPTYRFVPGVAETSLAHRTAARLGVTRDELLALVESAKRAR